MPDRDRILWDPKIVKILRSLNPDVEKLKRLFIAYKQKNPTTEITLNGLLNSLQRMQPICTIRTI